MLSRVIGKAKSEKTGVLWRSLHQQTKPHPYCATGACQPRQSTVFSTRPCMILNTKRLRNGWQDRAKSQRLRVWLTSLWIARLHPIKFINLSLQPWQQQVYVGPISSPAGNVEKNRWILGLSTKAPCWMQSNSKICKRYSQPWSCSAIRHSCRLSSRLGAWCLRRFLRRRSKSLNGSTVKTPGIRSLILRTLWPIRCSTSTTLKRWWQRRQQKMNGL